MRVRDAKNSGGFVERGVKEKKGTRGHKCAGRKARDIVRSFKKNFI